ncbi:MAG: hypothetical protein H7A45_03270 [Verrucomicrobiales bacterium]|nr:hypothetical protein [Verrucomicrobiales bacterium]MCP5527786.1 hypothetical protein [Verrucomicrobiales bacterium]
MKKTTTVGTELCLQRVSDLFLAQLSPVRVGRRYERKHKRYKREFYMCYKFCC